MKKEFLVVATLLVISACSRTESPAPADSPAVTPSAAQTSFINKVWSVAESRQVEPGSLRIFLSDGTLVMASPNSTPAFGSWSYDGKRLAITEEGLEYQADILALRESEFRIRIHSPGEPVEIRFEPAKQTVIAREKADDAGSNEPAVAIAAPQPATNEPQPSALLGTAWRLQDLAGKGVVERVQATLEFPTDGRASGNGSCNRFNGVVTIEGNSITFGGVAATRMACADNAAMNQETAYFQALQDAERFEIDGQTLRIFSKDQAEPLRFAAAEATARPAGISPTRGPAGPSPTLTGIWTVVGHHIPGTSALTDNEARARYGETIRLTTSSATYAGERCREPGYSSSRVATDPWLASEYKLAHGSLKPIGSRSQIHVMKVTCGGAPWNAFGNVLLELDRDRALAPQDGAFFELRRDRDFHGVGQEPGWQLEMRKGLEIRFTYDYGKGTAITPAPAGQLDAASGRRTFHATSAGNDLEVVIVPVRCTDSMSGKAFPATVSVTLNGRAYRGCGEELATPYQG